MKRRGIARSAFFNLRASTAILFCAGAACSVLSATLLAFFHQEATSKFSQTTLSFCERVAYQRAIEDVYWRHRIWPKERRDPKPSLDSVMSQAQMETKVGDYLRDSQSLEADWHRPITAGQLQAEMDRMAQHTNQPEVLREVFAALGNDPFVIAECLARAVLAEGLLRKIHDGYQEPLDSRRGSAENQKRKPVETVTGSYTLPIISTVPNGCVDDTWTATSTTNAPSARASHTAVWTGNEMIVWGGSNGSSYLTTGGRYNPGTDSWTATSTTNAPSARGSHTAVWTGSEMIIWGGYDGSSFLNTGGRYNPGTDSWTATSTTNAPAGRQEFPAVWTGSEMIVWGGFDGTNLNTGGRYNPTMDSWTATKIINAPKGRYHHTAIWTGSEMIVWGGWNGVNYFNTGGKYNPSTDSWTATSTTNAPSARGFHTAVGTGSEMVVWGGANPTGLNTGGRYCAQSNSPTPTPTPTATATPRATPTSRVRPTPAPRP